MLDWVTMVLPLLLAVTLFSTLGTALALNVVLAGVGVLGGALGRRRGIVREKPKGRWLDESDSDDDAPSGTPVVAHRAKPPSLVLAEEAPLPTPISRTSSLSSPISRRRTSPSPDASVAVSMPDSPTWQFPPTLKEPVPRHHRQQEKEMPAPKRAGGHIPFLSVYRAHMMVVTVLCILAVDFPIFPRILGKCESFGTSLMDVGVGSFVFSLGIVSSRAFNRASGLGAALKSLRAAVPVLALGLVRLMMVKGAEYPVSRLQLTAILTSADNQEHVTEYGVHWNFFFTLGLVPAFSAFLRPLRRLTVKWTTVGLALAVVYQLVLSRTSLQAFLLSDARPGLLGENKEGLASLPGYIAIFLVGLSIGEHVLRLADTKADTPEEASEKLAKRKTELMLSLLGYAAASWIAIWGLGLMGISVSRRFANLPYVLWTTAYNTSYLAGFLALELGLFPDGGADACPPLLEAVNRNGLAVFLIANLLTGLINVSMQTMYAGHGTALAVLGAYSAGISAFAWAIRRYRIKI